jgi:hypothetical protein
MKELSTKEKELLVKDLCAKAPYGVKVQYNNEIYSIDYISPLYEEVKLDIPDNYTVEVFEIRPYLRPLSSMTEEEILKLYKIAYTTYYSDSLYYKNEEWVSFRDSIRNNTLCFESSIWLSNISKIIDYINANKFDYRGLISMGLALEAPKDMYS